MMKLWLLDCLIHNPLEQMIQQILEGNASQNILLSTDWSTLQMHSGGIYRRLNHAVSEQCNFIDPG